MANVPDNRFIAATSLEEYFVNNNTGLPLAGGIVSFWQDINRTNPKLVYELSGDPTVAGGYSFVPLPNPLILSATGNFQDANNNNIAVYYFPYDGLPATSQNTLDLYYITVTDSLLNPQFTRSAWPPIAEDLATSASGSPYENQISNSQFVEVTFYPATTITYSFVAAGSYSYQIAPDWILYVISNGAGSVQVTRTAIKGNASIPTQTPYTLTIIPGNNIAVNGLFLGQTLPGNPAIWSQSINGNDGYISAGILLAPGSNVSMVYYQNGVALTSTLGIFNNTTAIYGYYSATTQLPLSTSNLTAYTGAFTEINIVLPNTGAGTTFSSVQVVGLSTNQNIVPYVQESISRQVDHLFHYYNPRLFFKPINSYLTGWDFPLNPMQFGASGTIPAGVNASGYTWDQTIVYAGTSAAISYAADAASNAFVISTGATPSQFALVQYLDAVQARKILNNDFSVNLSAITNAIGGINGVVSIYYSTDATLPVIPSSIVGTLNPDGSVSGVNGTWFKVQRNLIGNIPGSFTIANGTSASFQNVGMWGWGANSVGATSATYFAIVVGFSALPATSSVFFNSISLVPGRVPTIPAPKTVSQTLSDCQQYYWKTYPLNIYPGMPFTPPAPAPWITTVGMLQFNGTITVSSGAANIIYSGASFVLRFPNYMRVPPSISIYSPITGAVGNLSKATNAGIGNVGDFPITNWTNSTSYGYVTNDKAFYLLNSGAIINFTAAPNLSEFIFVYHAVVDARLGIV